jgi:hypothetical protein
MNFYKTLFLCLLLVQRLSVDRSLQPIILGAYSVSKACGHPGGCLFSSGTQPVDENIGYPQGGFYCACPPGYVQGLERVFHRA